MPIKPTTPFSPANDATIRPDRTPQARASTQRSGVSTPAPPSAPDGLAAMRRPDSGQASGAPCAKRMRLHGPTAKEADPRDAGATTIVSGLRRHIATQSFDRMFMAGSIWADYQTVLTDGGLLKDEDTLTIEQLSSINLGALRKRLKHLDEREKAFLERFLDQDFFATHFTNATLDRPSRAGESMLSIFSRDKLIDRSMAFSEANTTDGDISQKGDSDYVFFALECTTGPSKYASRFGDDVYRVPFDSSVFQENAWAALDDLLGAQDKDAGSHMPTLSGLNAKER